MFEELTNEEMEKNDGDGLLKGLFGVIGAFACCVAGGACVVANAYEGFEACSHGVDACLEWALSPGWYIW